MPTAQPMISAKRWNQRVYRPTTTAGKVCRIQIPPSSCKLIENVLLSARAKPSAPMMIAEYPMPANQLGNMFWNSSGTDSWALLPCALTPAFTAGVASAM